MCASNQFDAEEIKLFKDEFRNSQICNVSPEEMVKKIIEHKKKYFYGSKEAKRC
jgi:hypothetical protein